MSDIVLILPYEKLEGVNRATETPSLGAAYLAGSLIKNGFSCNIIDMEALNLSEIEIIKFIKSERSNTIGISANLFTGNAGIRIARLIKKELGPNKIVIFGGAFPTSDPEKFLKQGMADAVALGEGELTLLEIMKNLKRDNQVNFKDIAGIAYLEDGITKFSPKRDVNKELDSLSFPEWRLFPPLKSYKTRSRKSPAAPVLTSRGCPFSCIYCSKDVFKSIFRPRSPENVIQEIDYLVRDFGVRQLDIMDDNFSLDRVRAEKILDLIIERNYKLAINLQLGVRADSVDENLIKKMKKAGVYKIAFGVESGDERVLSSIKKQLDLKRVIESTRLAKKAGMLVYGFFMFGLPSDNAVSMLKTIRFALKMNPSIANFVITIPFPGTELFELVKAKGRFLVDTKDGLKTGFYGNKVFYELDGLKEKEVLYFYRLAYKLFYLRPAKILSLIFSIRSVSEMKWLLNTGLSLLSPMLKTS